MCHLRDPVTDPREPDTSEHTGGGVSELASPHPSSEYLLFTPDSTTLAIATMRTVSLRAPPGADGRVHRAGPGTTSRSRCTTSRSRSIASGSPRCATGAASGSTSAAAATGWYLSTGTHRVSFGYFSADGTRFVATDASGRALIVDLGAGIFGPTSSRRRPGV